MRPVSLPHGMLRLKLFISNWDNTCRSAPLLCACTVEHISSSLDNNRIQLVHLMYFFFFALLFSCSFFDLGLSPSLSSHQSWQTFSCLPFILFFCTHTNSLFYPLFFSLSRIALYPISEYMHSFLHWIRKNTMPYSSVADHQNDLYLFFSLWPPTGFLKKNFFFAKFPPPKFHNTLIYLFNFSHFLSWRSVVLHFFFFKPQNVIYQPTFYHNPLHTQTTIHAHTSESSGPNSLFIPNSELTLGPCLSTEVKHRAALNDWLLSNLIVTTQHTLKSLFVHVVHYTGGKEPHRQTTWSPKTKSYPDNHHLSAEDISASVFSV